MTISVVLISNANAAFIICTPRRRLYLARQHSTTLIYRIGHQ